MCTVTGTCSVYELRQCPANPNFLEIPPRDSTRFHENLLVISIPTLSWNLQEIWVTELVPGTPGMDMVAWFPELGLLNLDQQQDNRKYQILILQNSNMVKQQRRQNPQQKQYKKEYYAKNREKLNAQQRLRRQKKSLIRIKIEVDHWKQQIGPAEVKEIMLAAVNQNGRALKYAPAELKKDKDFVLAAVNQNGRALWFASAALQNDKEIVLAAVNQDGRTLRFASAALKNDKDILMAAVARHPVSLIYISEPAKSLLLEIIHLKKKIAESKSVPVTNLITGKEEIMALPSSCPSCPSSPSSSSSSKKRKHMSIEQVGEEIQKNVKIKIEQIRDDLEDAQELAGHLVLSENQKMTEIDRLKEEMRNMQARINELKKS